MMTAHICEIGLSQPLSYSKTFALNTIKARTGSMFIYNYLIDLTISRDCEPLHVSKKVVYLFNDQLKLHLIFFI